MKFIILRNFRSIPVIFCFALILTTTIGLILMHPSFAQTKNMTDKDILKNKVIAIDPGHGGGDPGAVGVTGSLEKDINLSLSLYLQKYLERNGATVIMTRKKDVSFSDIKREDLDTRAELITKANADIFIGMQCNASPDQSCYGAQVFYYPTSKKGEALAEKIQAELWTETQQEKQREAQTISAPYILHTISIPAIIVEAGFLSNPEEETLLQDKAYQKSVSKAVYKGIVDYYKTKPTFLPFF